MDLKEDLLWKDTFISSTFNVDECLSKFTQKSDLETLKRELKNYGNVLHEEMGEILKTETEAIVNLAEYLANLGSKIEHLSIPVSQLKEEIKSLFELIKNVKEQYRNNLDVMKVNNYTKKQLMLKLDLIASAVYIDGLLRDSSTHKIEDLTVLERAVTKFSFQKSYLSEFGVPSSDNEIIILKIETKLVEQVNEIFLRAVKEENRELLTCCLRMYNNLERQSDAEKLFQIQVIRPAFQNKLCESYLDRCGQDVSHIYNELLYFLNHEMDLLNLVVTANSELKQFNFIINSFWKEIDKQSREGLPYLAAPGNPELFQKRFKHTWSLLSQIALKCGQPDLIKIDETFQNHIKRFNLPVYFEIRFQQIAGQFESHLLPTNSIYSESNVLSCNLKVTVALYEALEKCFSGDIFIDHLADQFLKLSMLLISRYLKWFEALLEQQDMQNWEDFLVKSLVDLGTATELTCPMDENSLCNSIYSIVPQQIHTLVLKVCKLNKKLLTDMFIKYQGRLVAIKVGQCTSLLQNVGAIPRLYRRTNKSAPKEPSSYMVEGVKPVIEFKESCKSLLEKTLQPALDKIVLDITKEYLRLVEDVLSSVCKTEESLRRLKNRNLNISDESTNQASQETTSDEMKIREQIRLDVAFFIKTLNPIASAPAKKVLEDLRLKTC